MNDPRSLELRFVLDSDASESPSTFVALFEYAEDFVRYFAEEEALSLFEELELPADWQRDSIDTLRHLSRTAAAPAEVLAVNRRSPWTVALLIASPTLLFFLRQCIHPVVKQAWNDSRLRELLREFLRDRVFMGAKRKAQKRVVTGPRRRGLKAKSVSELRESTPERTVLEIRLERTEILEAKISDAQVIEDGPDHRRIFDAADDPHGALTLRTDQGIDFVDLLYQPGLP